MEIEGGGTHGPKVHLWGGITSRGDLTLEVFEENLESDRYVKIMKKKKQELNQMFPEGWIWQQDGSGVHRSNDSKDFVRKNMDSVLEFLGYSPDLSPIENVWGWLKGQVNNDMPTSVDGLRKCIRKHWKQLNEEFLQPYFDSMPERVAAVIENAGGKINY